MEQQLNEIRRMQQLAGIISEAQNDTLEKSKKPLSEDEEMELFDIIVSNQNKLFKQFNLGNTATVSGGDEGEPVIITNDNGNEVDFIKMKDWENNKTFYKNNKGIGKITLNGIDIIYIVEPY